MDQSLASMTSITTLESLSICSGDTSNQMAHEALASTSDSHDNSQLAEAIRMLNIRNSQVEDSASEDAASTSRKNTVSKSRRLSESGIPSGLKQNR